MSLKGIGTGTVFDRNLDELLNKEFETVKGYTKNPDFANERVELMRALIAKKGMTIDEARNACLDRDPRKVRLQHGLDRPTWDEYWLALLPVVKSRASCPRRQGGVVIVDSNNNIISTGYNGPPSGMPNCTEHPCGGENDPSGDTTKCMALHAEHNAIYFAGDRRSSAHTMYCTTEPCLKCALEILQTPIKRVVYMEPYPNQARVILAEAGIQMMQVQPAKEDPWS